MSKRKARFVDDGRDEVDMDNTEGTDFKSKHSLDSDEEDDAAKRKYEILQDDDLDGQEDATIDYDGEIKITPFNMKEEMEEGHFDTEGNYYLDNTEEIKDNWMDNIDWVRVKAREEKSHTDEGNGVEDDEGGTKMPEEEKISTYRQMTSLMKSGENVLKALKRLGANSSKASASNRWLKNKKRQKVSVDKDENAENLERLTGFADVLMQCGDFEAYQYTYEKLNFLVQSYEKKIEAQKIVIPDGTEDDDALDMFADSVDSKITDKPEPANPTTSDEVKWEFKWQDEDGEEIHGPHTSSEMHQWVEDGYFPDGVFVRKLSQGPDAAFYNSKRIDFELYIGD